MCIRDSPYHTRALKEKRKKLPYIRKWETPCSLVHQKCAPRCVLTLIIAEEKKKVDACGPKKRGNIIKGHNPPAALLTQSRDVYRTQNATVHVRTEHVWYLREKQ